MKTSYSRCRQARPRAFTLIELLTVIAIIGILAAILIPVVGKMRQTARKSAGASDLRQMGIALFVYCSDNKGTLPSPAWSGSNYGAYVYDFVSGSSNSRNLCRYLQPYFQTPPSTNGAWMESPTFKPASFKILNTGTASRAYQYPYLINHNKDGSIDPNTAINPFASPSWKIVRITSAPSIWLITDLDKLNLPSNAAPGGSFIAETPFNGNSRNVLYFDGHVTSVAVSP